MKYLSYAVQGMEIHFLNEMFPTDGEFSSVYIDRFRLKKFLI